MAQFNLHNKQYCVSLTEYKRLQTQEVWIGHIPMGAGHPIRRQSMTNTDTNDTWATVNQIKRIADAGAEYARMTTRTINEAENLNNIKETLFRDNYRIPLIADVHFNNRIAEKAAVIVDKVRINPGNYAVRFSRKREPEEIRKQFIHLIDLCKSNDTALRIGVNHGSLSRRIMDLYGDTPRGMVESALEYIKICEEQNFHNVVISLKSSNTRVMVQANRLLMHEMLKRERIYPLHLGVTEAGEGEDGRIKSAVGIGALLVDGIGDTIRVSLTEAPEKEIPVAKTLSEYMLQKHSDVNLPELTSLPIDPFSYSTRTSSSAGFIGGEDPPVVIGKKRTRSALKPDLIISHSSADEPLTSDIPLIQPYNIWLNTGQPENHYPLFNSIALYLENREEIKSLCFIETSIQEFDQIECLRNAQNAVLIIRALSENPTFEQRRFIFELMNKNIDLPVIVHKKYNENLDDLRLKAASDLGLLFLDGLADGVFLENYIEFPEEELLSISFGILQASRSRIYKTEFISCPGCGRTQFNLEKTAEKIRERMGHLKGLKIAIMGCIVNGPGEMADADYGYVGAGPGKITLYRNKEVVKRNIPEEKAVEELEKLIQEYGDWEIRKK